MSVLNNLYDHVMPRGLILIDEYYDWMGCGRAAPLTGGPIRAIKWVNISETWYYIVKQTNLT